LQIWVRRRDQVLQVRNEIGADVGGGLVAIGESRRDGDQQETRRCSGDSSSEVRIKRWRRSLMVDVPPENEN
jgi:hypothetical protein